MDDTRDKVPSSASPAVVENPWADLRRLTPARLALGRAGGSLPTAALLRFQLDHARAVDAVHHQLRGDELAAALQASPVVGAHCPSGPARLRSRAGDRPTYLQRPDLGRQLDERSYETLYQARPASDARPDLALVIGDGLSALAVQLHALPFLEAFIATLASDDRSWSLAPISIVSQARVAIGDDVGEALGARTVLMLIGERPGLSSPDSMGLYLTWSPRRGRHDAQRNCISNVRDAGLPCAEAARRAHALLCEAFRLQLSGVELKDRSEAPEGAHGLDREPRQSFRLVERTARGAGK